MPIATPQGTLDFKSVDTVTFVGASSNTVIDTTTGSLGVGVDGNGPTSNLHVVGHTRLEGDINMLHTSNTAAIKLNSNVVTEFPRSKKFMKFPRVALTSAAGESSGYQGYYVTESSNSTNTNRHSWKAFDMTFATDTSDNGWANGIDDYSGSGNTYQGSSNLGTGAVDGEWIKLQLPHKIRLEYMKIWLKDNDPTRIPDSWILYGSDDNTNWTELLSKTGQGAVHENTYNVNANSVYNYLGVVVTKISGQPNYFRIMELEYFGTPEYDPEADGVDVVVKSVPNVPNTDWLEVYYDAKNYTSGTTVQDESTPQRNGTITTGVTSETVDGIKSFKFAGANNNNIISTAMSLPSGSGAASLSVAVWFKRTVTNTTGLLFTIGNGGANTAPHIYINSSQGMVLDWWSNNVNVLDKLFLTNRWYHLVYTYSGGSHAQGSSIFIDGEPQALGPASNGGSILNLDGSDVLTIGSYPTGSYPFTGNMANFRLFNRALTQDEIYQLYAYQKEYFGHGDLSMTLKAGRLGIGTSEPRVALDVRGNVIARGLREDAGRDYILGLAPNIWSVGGDSQDRITSGAINLGPHTFIQKVNGRSVWVMGAQDTYVDIMSTISTTDTTVTQAIALGIPMGVQKGGILATQLNAGSSSGNVNHQIGYNLTKNIMYDNFAPSGGGQTTTSTLDMSKESILVVRRNGTGTGSLTLWYNGVKFEELTYSEIFSGTTPDRTRLGARDLVAVFNNTPIGLGFGAYAAWTRALTDNEIRYLTYDKMTSI